MAKLVLIIWHNLHNGNRPLLSMDSLMVFGMDAKDTLLDDDESAVDDFFFFFGLSSTYLLHVADFDRPLCRYVLLPPPWYSLCG